MKSQPRLLAERSIEAGIASETAGLRPIRSVTVNLAESPLGWLFARGFVTKRQFDAGERLRSDWERAQLAPRVTMAWDSAPVSRGRCGGRLEPLACARRSRFRRAQGRDRGWLDRADCCGLRPCRCCRA